MLNPVLNYEHFKWHFLEKDANLPEFDKDLVILVEHDVVHDKMIEFPFTRCAILRKNSLPNYGAIGRWELKDADPETEEQILEQYFTVMAWRYY